MCMDNVVPQAEYTEERCVGYKVFRKINPLHYAGLYYDASGKCDTDPDRLPYMIGNYYQATGIFGWHPQYVRAFHIFKEERAAREYMYQRFGNLIVCKVEYNKVIATGKQSTQVVGKARDRDCVSALEMVILEELA